MALNTGDLFDSMMGAAQGLAGDIWSQMETFAIPELKKIALQIVEIAENIDDFTPEGAKLLLAMQLDATAAVIVAMTTLTLLAVQTAINAIVGAIRDFVNGAIGIPLIG